MKIKNKLYKKRVLFGWSLAAFGIVGILIFYVYPFIDTIYYSVVSDITTKEYIGMENYYTVLNSNAFQLAFKNTVKFYGAAIPIIIILPFIIAVWTKERMHDNSILNKAIFMSMLIPSVSIIVFIDLLCEKNGIISCVNV